jgi:hypothetical protein
VPKSSTEIRTPSPLNCLSAWIELFGSVHHRALGEIQFQIGGIQLVQLELPLRARRRLLSRSSRSRANTFMRGAKN